MLPKRGLTVPNSSQIRIGYEFEYDILENFQFQKYLKNADVTLGSKSENFEIENILAAMDPLGKTSIKANLY